MAFIKAETKRFLIVFALLLGTIANVKKVHAQAKKLTKQVSTSTISRRNPKFKTQPET